VIPNPRRLRQLSVRALPYFLIPAIGVFAPLLVIPAISASYGVDGWGAVAVALSIGGTSAVVAELGWGVVGPQQVARDPGSARAYYGMALTTRMLAVLLLAPIAALLTYLMVDSHAFAAAVLAAAVTTTALSPTWYFYGRARPLLALGCEAGPRATILIGTALLIRAGAPLWAYGVGVFLASMTAVALAASLGGAGLGVTRVRIVQSPGVIRQQFVLIAGRITATIFTALPTALLALVSAGGVALFAGADRPLRIGLGVLAGGPARMQSWLGSTRWEDLGRRCQQTLLANFALGAVAGAAYAFAMPPASTILFAGEVDVPINLAVLGGALVLLIATSRGFGLCLVAVGAANHITTGIVFAALLALPAILVLGSIAGAYGTFFALILAETAGIAAQARALVRNWPKPALLR